MSVTDRVVQAYFNYAYNPVYDLVATQPGQYHKLQQTCIDMLELKTNDRVLCVGVGTGNEVHYLLQANENISIVGIDLSRSALRRAQNKAARMGQEIELQRMDARCLTFPDESFNKVICIHLMDFMRDNGKATEEMFRVLKRGGRFVITYPSYREGMRLGVNLLRDNIHGSIDSGQPLFLAMLKAVVRMPLGIVYLPLLFRPGKKSYLRSGLETMMMNLGIEDCRIEEDTVYNDFIVSGEK